MAKNAVTIFDSKQVAIPAHLQQQFGDETNITDRVSVPSLSYSGKVWAIHRDGEKVKITKKDEDGDEIPVSVIRVVVLDYAKRRGRAYYEGAYDPEKQTAPLCWSEDGVKPHPSIAEPQCSTCEKCPWSAKGSKVTENNKAVTACSQHRMVVVAPLSKLDMPLRLKLAITSDWDKQNEKAAKENWFAFNNYTDALRARSIGHTAMVTTKMKFDQNVDYPKVLFSPDRFITEEEAEIVQPLLKSEEVQKLLSGTWTPAGVDGQKIDEDEDEQPKAKAAPKKKAAPVEDEEEEDDPPPKSKKAPPKKAAAPVEDDEEEEDEVEVIPPKKTAPAKAAPKKAAEVEDVEDEEDDPPPPPKSKKAPPKKAAPVEDDEEEEDEPAPKPKKGKGKADAGDPLSGILSDWGED